MKKTENNECFMIPLVMKDKIAKTRKIEVKNFKICTSIIITIMVLLLFFSGYTLAKNIEEKLINAKTQIAEPILIIENNPSVDVTANNNYGVYKFKVKNYNKSNKITDVDLKYNIEILSDKDFDSSISFKLFENDKEVKLNNRKSEYMQISKNNKDERIYKLEIIYDKNKTISVSDIIQKVQVKIHSEQLKG